MRARTLLMTTLAIASVAVACGGDDDSSSAATSPETSAAVTTGEPSGDQNPSTETGDKGQLVLGDETVAFDRTRCFLQEQDAAAGGGKILFTAQAFGTNAAGDPITLDVSRYDEDSQFTGDDIIVDIGDPFSDDAVSLASNADLGTVNMNGSTLSATELTFVNSEDFSEQSGSFEINC